MVSQTGSDMIRSLRRILPILLLVIAKFLHAAEPAATTPIVPIAGVIRNISIDLKDIFDPTQRGENKLFYRMVNSLHFTTRHSVIKKELLLREGDAYDPLLIAESERALRKILHLRQVHIRPVPAGGGMVDLIVVAHDTWSTEPTLSMSGVGDEVTGKIGIKERNFLGYGKEASFMYKRDTDVIRRSFAYNDPNILGTHWRMQSNYAQQEDGVNKVFSLKRPFYSSITPWSMTLSGETLEQDSRLFSDGSEVLRYHNKDTGIRTGYARSLGSTPRSIRRAGLGYRFADNKLLTGDMSQRLLEQRRYHVAELYFEWERTDYIRVQHIKKANVEEYFNMGPSLIIEPGFSQRWTATSQPATFINLEAHRGFLFGFAHFAMMTLEGTGKYEDGGWQNTRPSLQLEYYNHFSERQTFALNLKTVSLIHPDPDNQLLLGGESGLRGYQLRQFSGNKLLLANMENRLFFTDDWLHLTSLGGVVFMDTGYVWPENTVINLRDLKTDVGAGLRFGLSRASFGMVLRLDVGYAVSRVPGESRTVITFGSEHVF